MIEFQNGFASEGGSLHGAVKDVMESSNMLENGMDAVAKARELGATIIHAPITFAEGYPELGDNPYGILKGVVDTRSFRKGTWGAEFVEGMQPEEGDLVVEGKHGKSIVPLIVSTTPALAYLQERLSDPSEID